MRHIGTSDENGQDAKKLPHMANHLEQLAFRHAASFEEYNNSATLVHRINHLSAMHMVIMAMKEKQTTSKSIRSKLVLRQNQRLQSYRDGIKRVAVQHEAPIEVYRNVHRNSTRKQSSLSDDECNEVDAAAALRFFYLGLAAKMSGEYTSART